MTQQHTIPTPPPITDAMTDGAVGTGSFELLGNVVTVYDVPADTQRGTLLLFDTGRVVLVSCDPGYRDDAAMTRDETRWEVALYDATDTPAGEAMRRLAPGHWL